MPENLQFLALMPDDNTFLGATRECHAKPVPHARILVFVKSLKPLEDSEVKMRVATVLAILLAFVFAFTAAWEREGMCEPQADDNKTCANSRQITSCSS
jgi:hypothetical protein